MYRLSIQFFVLSAIDFLFAVLLLGVAAGFNGNGPLLGLSTLGIYLLFIGLLSWVEQGSI